MQEWTFVAEDQTVGSEELRALDLSLSRGFRINRPTEEWSLNLSMDKRFYSRHVGISGEIRTPRNTTGMVFNNPRSGCLVSLPLGAGHQWDSKQLVLNLAALPPRPEPTWLVLLGAYSTARFKSCCFFVAAGLLIFVSCSSSAAIQTVKSVLLASYAQSKDKSDW